MKKLLFTIIAMIMPMLASADKVEIDGIYYNLLNKEKIAEVTQNPGKYSGNVNIPEKVEYKGMEYSVTTISNNAFGSCRDLTSITIPNSVTSIGSFAFEYCSGLTSVNIPNGVPSLEEYVFYHCSGLTSVNIPNSVTRIRNWAFLGCYSLTSVNIPNAVTSIGEAAFQGCSSLTSITIPNSVTSIGKSAFRDCSGLTSITIPNSVTSINEQTFRNCSSLTSVTIPNNVTSIGQLAFANCSDLTSVIIPNSLTRIGGSAFEDCIGLTSIIIPNSVTYIGGRAFYECRGLISITIPNSLTSIEEQTFFGCSGLTSITIPNSVTSIGKSAFSYCSGLTSITIPNSVTSIGMLAFANCSSLTSVTIGNGIKNIEFAAFSQCPELTDVYCYAETVPTSGGFDYDKKMTLHVPASSVSAYKASEYWKPFYKIVGINGESSMHTLTYIVDEEVYRTYQIEEGEIITPEPAPVKEGYTFSGWSEIPETMPAQDVTVTGTFTINKYKLTYMVDDEVYSAYDIEYGANITPEAEPTKEGYKFSGWSEIPETMPAKDVIITGTFTEIVKSKPDFAINANEHFNSTLGYFTTTLGQTYNSPQLSNPYNLSPIEWTSSDPYVANVDKNGIVTVYAAGGTQIKAYFAGNDEYEAGFAEYYLLVLEGYKLTEEGVEITSVSDQIGDVTIEETVEINGKTLTVTGIADFAFAGNTSLTSVILPNSIKTIGENAFFGCFNLKMIKIGNGIMSIGSKAFGEIAGARTRGDEDVLKVYCNAYDVPTTAKDTFEGTDVSNAILIVPDGYESFYNSSYPWSGFGKIIGEEAYLGIDEISVEEGYARIYDLNGNRIGKPKSGVNIIKLRNGEARKIVIKSK